MSLTRNSWTGLADGGNWDVAGNWSLNVVPGPTHEAYIDAASTGSIPGGSNSPGPFQVGALTIADGNLSDIDFQSLAIVCLGNLSIHNTDGISIQEVDGDVSCDDGTSQLFITVLNGSTRVSFSDPTDQGASGGTGTYIFDVPDSAVQVGSSFTGTLSNVTSPFQVADLSGQTLNAAVKLLPNRAAFTNFTGGAPDGPPTAVIAAAAISGARQGICIF